MTVLHSVQRLATGWTVRERIPIGARFSAPVLIGSEAHPASYTVGTGSFPGLKQLGRGVDHPSLSSTEVKERVEPHLYSPFGPSWPVLGRTLPLPLPYDHLHNSIKHRLSSS
jgi:hypothetical protein